MEGGNYLISYYDQRRWLEGLELDDTPKQYSDDQVFKKYMALLSREILNVIDGAA